MHEVERASQRSQRRLPSLSPDALATFLLAALSFVFFGTFLLLGLTFHEDDLENFYHPVLLYLVHSLRQGVFPLWAPEMFAGFPFSADGSHGVLYPLNWLALVLPAESAAMWLIAARSALTSLFTYAFARSLGMSVSASLLTAIVYTFSGSSVGHWIHLSVGHSALTLPLGLLAVEKAHRAAGHRAVLWLLLAALAVGLLWLGLHPQVALISTLAIACYGAFRELADGGQRPWPRGLVRLALGSAGVAAPAVGLAAGQLWPMLELGSFSPRAHGLPYSLAATYALPPHNFATFFWPYAFVTPGGFDWGLTNRWETAVYVGTLTLVLAGLALVGRRDRHVFFWATTAVLGLWIALGPYIPLNLHYLLYQTPLFASFRAPARFAQLADLGLAIMAGYGLDLLRQPSALPALRRWAARYAVALMALAAGGVAAVVALAWKPEIIQRLLPRLYLTWPRVANWRAEQIWPAVQETWSFLNPRWLIWTGFLLAGAVAILAWRRSPTRGGWSWWCTLLITVDLLLFAAPFWDAKPLATLAKPSAPTLQYVLERAGHDRVISLPGSHSEPNRFIPYGVRDVNTYGPLSSQRYQEYLALAKRGDNRLLDLLGVRWVLAPLASRLPSELEGVRFDLRLPLAVVSSRPTAPTPAFKLAAPFPTRSIRLVARMSNAAAIADGQAVAEIVLRSADGSSLALPLQAGIHLAEMDATRVDVQPNLAHQPCRIAARETTVDAAGRRFDRLTYFGQIALPTPPFPVSELAFRGPTADVRVEVFGLSLVGPDGTILPSDGLTNARFVERLRDDTTRVLENRHAVPRVFLASRAAVMAPDSRLLYTMADQMADPTTLIYLEEPVDPALLAGTGASGTARIVSEEPTHLEIAVAADRPSLLFVADPYYPGWQATVDGRPTPLLRADYIFRAVAVPAGSHLVALTFEPHSARWGLALSAFTLAFMGVLALLLRLRMPSGT